MGIRVRFVSLSIFSVPPTILELSNVEDVYRDNDPAAFIVTFLSRFRINTLVTWLHNDSPLNNKKARIATRFSSEDGISPATTSLQFSEIRRENAGNYTVSIRNNFTLIPPDLRTATVDFNVVFYGML